jgi:hypothetical protein
MRHEYFAALDTGALPAFVVPTYLLSFTTAFCPFSIVG